MTGPMNEDPSPAAADPGQGVPSAPGFGVHAEDSDVVEKAEDED
ncbi:hypothetical protein O6P37_15015 [Mycobacterium sp. CPCC 205372]|uniref:Uncharacterized protein n=1 Tax=Mycobacterium hippophais TaxID=3016340 RepID=A0ABT4PUD6_9MYCO|nr:hypothetical protein [Mycobacterium hippophais]MCZ8380182.1 hypothetical protein [Mycobacterium hippophais]